MPCEAVGSDVAFWGLNLFRFYFLEQTLRRSKLSPMGSFSKSERGLWLAFTKSAHRKFLVVTNLVESLNLAANLHIANNGSKALFLPQVGSDRV